MIEKKCCKEGKQENKKVDKSKRISKESLNGDQKTI